MKTILRCLGALVLLFGATACVAAPQARPQAVGGVLDLRQWDFASNGVINLDGAWEFYWGQLLAPTKSISTSTHLITVPDSWRDAVVNQQTLGSDGYATYRLVILLPSDTRAEPFLALKMPVSINTAHRLYINGELAGAVGQVGPSAAQMTPQHRPYVAVLTPIGERAEILLQVSIFYQYDGGITQPIALGTPAQIQQLNEQQWGQDFFLLGSLFIMGLYHLALFSLRRQDKAPLYFGLFCLLVVGGFILLTQPQIFAAAISPSWEVFARALLLLASIVIVTQALFFHTLFPQAALPRVLAGLLVIMGGLAGLALGLPVRMLPTLGLPLALYLLVVHDDTLVQRFSRWWAVCQRQWGFHARRCHVHQQLGL
jgi:hypothetical protein